jgi:hypothetical protein
MADLSGIDRLENDVLDDSVPLATLLRQVIILGGRSSSEPLRLWAQQELRGYDDPESNVPGYRIIAGQLKADITSGSQINNGYEISTYDLPEELRGAVKNDIPIRWSIGEIHATVQSKPGSHIRLGGINMPEIARITTTHQRKLQGNPLLSINSIYWSVSTSTLAGILDQVRTRLAEFVAEIRASMPDGATEPTSEQIRHAVSIINITTGDNSPVRLAAPIAVSDGDASATSGVETSGPKRGLFG